MSADTDRSEADYLPLSALQHLVFCERQCALIHVERLWVDNRLTIEGSQLHDRAHDSASESRGDLRIARGVHLISHRLGLVGRADVVEFHKEGAKPSMGLAALDGADGGWRVHPVEYKRGRPKTDRSDDVQLCAQALCLEEMLRARVERGALYYGKQRQRTRVSFDSALRHLTESYVDRLHELIATGDVPRLQKQPKCRRCSLYDVCLPHATAPSRSASRYLGAALRKHLGA